jgi:MFS family permease
MPLPSRLPAPLASWIGRWSDILPLLVAEFVVWLGFGALLPVMPLYFREHGVDLATLGVIIAAWPAARLVGEPIFGWLADRVPRVPLMVAGNIGAGIFQFLPLVFVGAVPFLVLRALQGLSTAVYDPAARGYITDATPPERRGEAFGLYGAAQMGGLVFGPAIGGLGSASFGGIGFVFVFGAISSFVAALAIGLRVRETPGLSRQHPGASFDATEFPARPTLVHGDGPVGAGTSAGAGTTQRAPDVGGPGPARVGLANRLLLAAILVNFGGNFSAGTYDVVWSIFLDGLGAGLELIGLTFAMFGLPILILSPYFGRRVDRGGLVWFVLIGGLAPAVTGVLYPLITDPGLAVPLILVEATGFAMLNPALYAIVAAGSPPGRSSTAQGIYGASGTMGFVVASLVSGGLAEVDIRLPFYVFAAVMFVSLVAGLAVGGRALRRVGGRSPAPAPPAAASP